MRCDLAEGLPAAMGDAGQVRQVLVNLLLNAQQAATRAGEVVVSTGSRDGHRLVPRPRRRRRRAADRAEAIFKPFVTPKTRGTGLGLSISRRVIELQGGRLALDNPGEPGASFTLTLPHRAGSRD